MRRLLLTATFLAAVAVPAAAQDSARVREREREREDRVRTFMYSIGPGEFSRMSFRRERLGVLVDLTADPARDSVGARVAGVTPGGPADRAGVRTGDLIVRLNGARLAALRSDRRDDEMDQSRPGLRLIELASRLDGGDSVRLELRRDGRTQTVSFVVSESGFDRITELSGNQLRRFAVPFPPEIAVPGGPENRMRVMAFGGEGLADLELVRVGPGLSEYFGTSEGLLVVDVGTDSTLGLRAGDVILSIGGRRPTSPSHAMRILGTYDANEAVSFEVMRQKRRVSVNGRMPRQSEQRWRIRSNRFEMQPGMELPRVERIRISL
ncbi:MAG: PDZ domain-containing protein [Gemmatimonadales bacterium]|nr:PDZ domain-containing protein [Gemmatimonadales bacterium]